MNIVKRLEQTIAERQAKIDSARVKLQRQTDIIKQTTEAQQKLEGHILRWEGQQTRDRNKLTETDQNDGA